VPSIGVADRCLGSSVPIDGLAIARAAPSGWRGSANSGCGANSNAISKRKTPFSVPPVGSASAVIDTNALRSSLCVVL
jgi:hypothetical protein